MTSALTNEPERGSDLSEPGVESLTCSAPNTTPSAENSYGQIVKSSTLIGGSQVITMIVGLVRMKFLAIFIGPEGIGLMAIFQSITDMAGTIAGMGINATGAREVAQNLHRRDITDVGKTAMILRRISWFTGFLGMLVLLVAAPWISEISFHSQNYSWAIAALSVSILLANVSAGQRAVIQGHRRIGHIAMINVWSALVGAVASIAFCAVLGLEGIVPAMIALSVASVSISTWYVTALPLKAKNVSCRETWNGFRRLAQFGVALVIGSLIVAGVAYATRLMIQSSFGLSGVGIYSAAFVLSGLFVGFVISAMGTDFLPRLSAASEDNRRMTLLINEQTEIGLLLALPGILVTLVFAPILIPIVYTAGFSESTILLKWFLLGCLGRIVSWPMGYSMQVKNQGTLFVTTELVFSLLQLVLTWGGLHYFGLKGPAIAFAVVYSLYTLALWALTRFTIEYQPSKEVLWLVLFSLGISVALFGLSSILPTYAYLVFGFFAIVIVSIWALKQIISRVGTDEGLGYRLSKLLKRIAFLNFLFPERQ